MSTAGPLARGGLIHRARRLLERHPIAIALVAGVLVRLVILVGYRGGALLANAVLAPVGDQEEYLGLAANLLAGRGFTYGHPGMPPYAPTASGPGPYIYRTPGYPLVLSALSWATGGHLAIMRAVQVMATVGFVPLGVPLLRRFIASPLLLALASLALALNPFLVYFSLTFLSDWQFQLLLAGGLVALFLLKPGQGRRAILAGALLGLAALTRSEGWYFGWTAILIAAVSREPAQRRLTALVLGAFLLTMTPWIARNWIAFHEFLPTQTGTTTLTLTHAHAPEYTGRAWPGYAEEVARINAAAPVSSQAERERFVMKELLAFFLAHPREFLAGTLANAGHFYALSPHDVDYGNAEVKTPYQGSGYTLLSWAGYTIWLPFLPIGLYVAWRRARLIATISVAIFGVNLAIGALIHANIRIRSENHFLILAFALIGVSELLGRLAVTHRAEREAGS